MSKNLLVDIEYPNSVTNVKISYARIDNVSNPVYTDVIAPNPSSSPVYSIVDVPNGQYSVRTTPIYADGRNCFFSEKQTAPCPPIISLSAYEYEGDMVIQFIAPDSVGDVRLTIQYPNGGQFIHLYSAGSSPLTISLPNNVYGTFQVSMQSVKDPDTGFYSIPSAPVTVYRPSPDQQGQYTVINTHTSLNITEIKVAGVDVTLNSGSFPVTPSQSRSFTAVIGGLENIIVYVNEGSPGTGSIYIQSGSTQVCQLLTGAGTYTFSNIDIHNYGAFIILRDETC